MGVHGADVVASKWRYFEAPIQRVGAHGAARLSVRPFFNHSLYPCPLRPRFTTPIHHSNSTESHSQHQHPSSAARILAKYWWTAAPSIFKPLNAYQKPASSAPAAKCIPTSCSPMRTKKSSSGWRRWKPPSDAKSTRIEANGSPAKWARTTSRDVLAQWWNSFGRGSNIACVSISTRNRTPSRSKSTMKMRWPWRPHKSRTRPLWLRF